MKQTGAKTVNVKDPVQICKNVHTTGEMGVQIKEIIADCRELGVKKVGATHCTGGRAIQMFREEWGENFVELGVGRKISITLHE